MLGEFFSFKISREFIVLMFFIVATFFFFLYETEQMGVSQLLLEKSELETRMKMVKLENERLAMEIDDLKTDIGVIRIARERLRLVFPGEIVVKAVTSEEVQIQKIRNLNAMARKYEVKEKKREEVTSAVHSGGTSESVDGVEPEEEVNIDDSSAAEETGSDASGENAGSGTSPQQESSSPESEN